MIGPAGTPAGAATFADQSLLVVDANGMVDASGVTSFVALRGGGIGVPAAVLTVDNGAKLHIVGGMGGDVLTITNNFDDVALDPIPNGWLGDNLSTSTGLLSAFGAFDAGGYSVSLVSNPAVSVFPLLSPSMGRLVDSVFSQTRINTDSQDAGVRFLSRAVSDGYIGRDDPRLAAATIEGAAQLAVVGAVPGVTLSALNASTEAVTARTAFASPLIDNSKAASVSVDKDGKPSLAGLSAGNNMKNGLGLWIMPLYQNNHVWGMKAENFKTGYDSSLGGLALGADFTVEEMFRIGVAFNAGGGYAKSSGDFNKTENDFQFWGAALYGGWTMHNFGLTADVGYTGTYNDLRQKLPASMQMRELKADVNSQAVTTGLRAEYKLETPFLDIIPHAGARYTGLFIDRYKVRREGTVFKVDQSQQDIWTFPVGLLVTKDFDTDTGWIFKPQVDLSVIPATGDLKARSRSRIPGMGHSADLKTQVVDYLTWQGGAGFELKGDNLSLGLGYTLQASEHRTGHGVFGTMRYDF